eukprot:CAMPEP_0174854884 /NCGR_PEP_ID=MMETSP1114-20130205/31995_1 /TAXON_ID=312471 /ORGANISM="Neobodo designis, Strain CCAP 1951/1" /LENGTH=897 /DNA_ID=CAMNT_0016089593 /DNA_START=25 /DNA_END=2718 /DNA_ORIENTATION=-
MPEVVVWSDRWLNCSVRGEAFVRCWVTLNQHDLRVVFDRDDDPETQSIISMKLINLLVESNDSRFTIGVLDAQVDDDDVVFRCGEKLEYEATLDALTQRIVIAKATCSRCQQLIGQLERLMAERAQIQHHEKQLAAANSAAAEAQTEADDFRRKVQQHEREVLDQKEKAAAHLERARLAESRALAAERSERAAREELKSDSEKLQDAIREAERSNEALTGRNHELQERLAEMELQRESINEQHEVAKQLHVAATVQLAECAKEKETLANESALLRSQVRELEAAMQEGEHSAERVRGNMKSMECELTNTRGAMNDLKKSMAIAEAKLAAAETKLTADHQHLASVESMLTDAQRRIQDLEAELRSERRTCASATERVEALTREGEAERERIASALHAAERSHEEERTALLTANATLKTTIERLNQSLQVSAEERARLATVAEERALDGDRAREAVKSTEMRNAHLQSEVDELRAEADRRAARKFNDAAITTDHAQAGARDGEAQTAPFAQVLSSAPEMAEVCALHAAVGAADMVQTVCSALSTHLTAGGLAECGPVRERLTEFMQTVASAAARQSAFGEAVTPEPVRISRHGGAGGTKEDRTLARAAASLRELQAKIDGCLDAGDSADSPLTRGVQVATTAGFLECMRTFDAAANAVAVNHEFREAVMSYLRGPANSARATAAHALGSANRGHRNSAMLEMCRRLESDYCELFDHVLRCAGGRVVSDANWRRSVARATSECTTLAHALLRDGDATSLEDAQRRASGHAETVKQLVTADSSVQHAAATRELVVAHAHLQMAIFVALRRRNRTLLHHDGAESIARFGVALKRAGQILEQSKLPGAQPHAAECLAGWPVVKHLVALPRCLEEEDRAFALMWGAVLATSHGTLIPPSTPNPV